jgi:hypothetical protein
LTGRLENGKARVTTEGEGSIGLGKASIAAFEKPSGEAVIPDDVYTMTAKGDNARSVESDKYNTPLAVL